MRAAYYETMGTAADVLHVSEMETPKPNAGEVLVRIAASGVNPSDVKLRSGARPGGMPFPRIIPNSDGAGEITAVGSDVDSARIGERVWIWNGQWQRPFGTSAEYIAIPTEQAITLPKAANFEAGACAGIPMLTARHVLLCDGVLTGQTVLIQGGAGAVGRYAIQMAKLSGAKVIATAGRPETITECERLGADHVINYRDNAAEAILDASKGGVDRIIESEFGLNINISAAVLNDGGTVASYGSAGDMAPIIPYGAFLFKNATIRTALVYSLNAKHRADAVGDVNRWLADGVMDHRIAGSYALDDVAKAHEHVERGDKIGAVILKL